MDLSLISGFLDAIRSFGIELTGSSESSQIVKLEYQDSKIIMSEYKQVRIILIMKESPSPEFIEALRLVSIETDEKFGRFLADFKGDIRPFKYIEKLIMQRLKTSFLYPLKIVESKRVKLNPLERELITKVKKILKSTSKDYFNIYQLIQKESCEPSEVKSIIDLIDKRVFEPILVQKYN
jgi:hypothetical protein